MRAPLYSLAKEKECRKKKSLRDSEREGKTKMARWSNTEKEYISRLKKNGFNYIQTLEAYRRNFPTLRKKDEEVFLMYKEADSLVIDLAKPLSVEKKVVPNTFICYWRADKNRSGKCTYHIKYDIGFREHEQYALKLIRGALGNLDNLRIVGLFRAIEKRR